MIFLPAGIFIGGYMIYNALKKSKETKDENK